MDASDPIHRTPSGDEGASALIVAVLLVALFAIAMIVVDVGAVYAERRQLQTAADAAALAGVQELPAQAPDDVYATRAKAEALDYGTKNSPAGSVVDPVVEMSTPGSGYYDRIKVTVTNPNTPLYFKVLLDLLEGSDTPQRTAQVAAKGVAIVSSPSGFGIGVMPFGVMAKEGTSATEPFGYAFNEQVLLKASPKNDPAPGNFQYLDLVGPVETQAGGASDVTNAIENGGVQEEVNLLEKYYTQTGNFPTDTCLNQWVGTDTHAFTDVTRQNLDGTVDILDWTCHRIIICPLIVQPLPDGTVLYSWNGANGTTIVQIVAFAYFYVEAWGGRGSDAWVMGRFIRPWGAGDPAMWGSYDPYGAVKFRLSE